MTTQAVFEVTRHYGVWGSLRRGRFWFLTLFVLMGLNVALSSVLERYPSILPYLSGLNVLLVLGGLLLTYRDNRRGDPKFRLEIHGREVILWDSESNEVFRARLSKQELGEECLRSSSRYGTHYRRVLRLGPTEHCLRLVAYDALLQGSEGLPLVEPGYVIPAASLARLEALLRAALR